MCNKFSTNINNIRIFIEIGDNMKVALIVLNYNSYKDTAQYVELVSKYNVVNKIVVVDNCSTDGMFNELLKLKSEKIDVISSEKNGGYSYGNNFGVKYLESKNEMYDYIIISNSDIYVEENAICTCIDELEKDSNLAVCAPRMFYKNGPARRSSWKLRTYFLDIIHSTRFLELLFYPILRKGEYSNKEYENNKLMVECISGAFFIIKYNILKEIGYLDENVFLFYEEDILGTKIKNKGYKIASINNVNFIHYESQTIGKVYNVKRKLKIMDKSKKYYQGSYNHVNKVGLAILDILNFIRKIELLIEVPIRKLLKK